MKSKKEEILKLNKITLAEWGELKDKVDQCLNKHTKTNTTLAIVVTKLEGIQQCISNNVVGNGKTSFKEMKDTVDDLQKKMYIVTGIILTCGTLLTYGKTVKDILIAMVK